MKAIQLDAYGGPEVLQLRDVIDPVAGAGELVVDIHAASINPVDWKIRNGARKDNLSLSFPYTPGIDFSGVVRAADDAVTDFGKGDEVYGVMPQTQQGTYAEATAVDASLVARKPAGLSHVDTAALSLVGFPPLLGFVGKLSLLLAGIEANRVPLVVIALLNSAISAWYYLRLVGLPVLAMPTAASDTVKRGVSAWPRVAAVLAAIAVVVVPLFANELLPN